MAWQIQHSTSEIEVRISPPVGDWETLLDEIQVCLRARPAAPVRLPRKLPEASSTETELLRMLRGTLAATGATLLPPVG